MFQLSFIPNGFYNGYPSWISYSGIYTYVIRWNGVDFWEMTGWNYNGEPRNYQPPTSIPTNGNDWVLYETTDTALFNISIGICSTPTLTPTQSVTPTPTLTPTLSNTPTLTLTRTLTPTPTATCPYIEPPIIFNSIQCGNQIPTAYAVSYVGGTIYWYKDQYETEPISIGPYNPNYVDQIPLTATTIWWVEAHIDSCYSTRISGNTFVCLPDQITATTSNSEICLGDSLTLDYIKESTYGTTYTATTWSANTVNGSGLSGLTNINPITITPTSAGTYTYYISATGTTNSSCGEYLYGDCMWSSSVQVTVLPQPVITSFIVSGDTNCDGNQNILLSASGTNISSYLWSPGNYTGSTQVINTSLHSNTTFTLSAFSQNNDCYVTTATTYPIYYVPDALSSASSAQCGYGIPYALPTSNYSVPNHTYRWYGSLTGSTILYEQMTENGYTQYGYPITSSTTFYVSEISVYGCESSRTAIVCTVTPSDEITYSASSVSILSGQSFSVIISGITGGVNTFDSVTISGDTGGGVIGTQSLSIDTDNPLLTFEYTITPTTTGTFTYLVLANDSLFGCTSFVIFTVTVT